MTQQTTTEPLPGILAAWCPPGWRRDPMTGKPVMPCIGKLLFPCDPALVPGVADVNEATRLLSDWLAAHSTAKPFELVEDAVELVGGILLDAAMAKRKGHEGLSQNTEVRLSNLIVSMLWTCGTVRIEKRGGEWVEVAGTQEGDDE